MAFAYQAVVFVHVLAATVLVGSSLSFVLVRRAIRGAQTVDELRGWLRFAHGSAATSPAAALALLASGIALGSQGWWTATWFPFAVAVFAFNVVFAVRPAHAVAAELASGAAASRPGPVPASLDAVRRSARLDVPHDLLLGNDLAMLFVMIVKPPLAGSCLALALANAAIWCVRRRRRAGLAARPSDAAAAAS
jgi:hypothetical protein